MKSLMAAQIINTYLITVNNICIGFYGSAECEMELIKLSKSTDVILSNLLMRYFRFSILLMLSIFNSNQ